MISHWQTSSKSGGLGKYVQSSWHWSDVGIDKELIFPASLRILQNKKHTNALILHQHGGSNVNYQYFPLWHIFPTVFRTWFLGFPKMPSLSRIPRNLPHCRTFDYRQGTEMMALLGYTWTILLYIQYKRFPNSQDTNLHSDKTFGRSRGKRVYFRPRLLSIRWENWAFGLHPSTTSIGPILKWASRQYQSTRLLQK